MSDGIPAYRSYMGAYTRGGKAIGQFLPHKGAIGPGTTWNNAVGAGYSKDRSQQVASRHDLEAFKAGRGLSGVLFSTTDSDIRAQAGFKHVLNSENELFKTPRYGTKGFMGGPRRLSEKIGALLGWAGMSAHNLVMPKRVSAPKPGGSSKKSKQKTAFSKYSGKRKGKGYKRIKRSRKGSKASFAKRVLGVMNKPGLYFRETSTMLNIAVNSQCFYAAPLYNASAGTYNDRIYCFNGYEMCYNAVFNLLGTPGDYDFYYVQNSRDYELTNVSNTEMYVRLHKVTCSNDKLAAESFLTDLVSFMRDSTYYSNHATVPAISIMQTITGPVDMPAGIAYKTPNGVTLARVMENVFQNEVAKLCYKSRGWRVKSGKMFLMPPQQTLGWKVKGKEFLWNKLYRQESTTAIEVYENKTSFYIVEAVGQTLKGDTQYYSVGSAPGNLIFMCSDKTKVTVPSLKAPEVFISAPYIHGDARSDYKQYDDAGVTFGPANNAAVPAV